MDKLGLPVGHILEMARTLLPRVSSQKRWLGRAMGSELPLLPVHTVEDIKLYHEVHKRLVQAEEEQRKAAAPVDEAVVITADCEPSIEELAVAINEAVTLLWMQAVDADDGTVPTVFFKTFDHVRMYQGQFEKIRNMMSTLVVHQPSLPRDVGAAGESYLWYHSQADPTRAAFPTGHPVVSSKTPKVSAKTHTHNWCGRQIQAANTTQRCEAQRLLASLGGFGTALLSRSDVPTCPLPSTLRGTIASGPKTGVKRGPHPSPGVCPRPNQNTPTKSPRRG